MTKALKQLRMELSAIQKFLDVSDIPTQQVMTFLFVAEKGEAVMGDLAEATGVAQSSVSRNVARLGNGLSPSEPGYGLLEAFEDPYYRKRKLVKLTPRGKELVKAIDNVGVKLALVGKPERHPKGMENA